MGKDNLISVGVIESKIFMIRGCKVMLDRDLAELYCVETRALNQAVKRNLTRFPEDFMLVLSRDEIMRISQSVTSLKFSKRVCAFTEQGVAMLSTVLNSEQAIQVNIAIMRTFTRLRKLMSTHKELRDKIEQMEKKYDKQFAVVFDAIKQLIEVKDSPKKQIGFHVK